MRNEVASILNILVYVFNSVIEFWKQVMCAQSVYMCGGLFLACVPGVNLLMHGSLITSDFLGRR